MTTTTTMTTKSSGWTVEMKFSSLARPRALPRGGRIRVVAPAGVVAEDKISLGVERLRAAGFVVEIDPQTLLRDHHNPFLAGDDRMRADALERAFRARDVDAIVCARGGYGAMRILPLLDPEVIAAHPKPLIGFSDITALHGFLAVHAGLSSWHGPLLSTLKLHDHCEVPGENEAFGGMIGALTGASEEISVKHLTAIHEGESEGPLIGGNLTLLASLVGTPWFPSLKGAILFFEEVGEPGYKLDRLLMTLHFRGVLDEVAGIAVGDSGSCGDHYMSSEKLGPFVERRLVELLGGRRIPVASGLPVGHGTRNLTLPFGTRARLVCDARGGHLVAQSAVTPVL